MMGVILTVLLVLAGSGPGPVLPPPEGQVIELPPLSGSARERCRDGAAAGRFGEAVSACREALDKAPDDLGLLREAARVEYLGGFGEESATLWQRLIDRAGWSEEAATGLALAQWRAGRLEAAESTLRDVVERTGSVAAWIELARYLSEYGRHGEAEEALTAALALDPERCGLYERAGTLAAEGGDHGLAATRFARAEALGCPSLRWARATAVERSLADPAYDDLLTPARVLDGIDEVGDDEVLFRLGLIVPRAGEGVTDDLVALATSRRSKRVRLTALGLLKSVAPTRVEPWRRLLAEEPDFVYRKHALRRIRELRAPQFAPLLEEVLAAPDTAGNHALARLALGELMYDTDRGERARRLLLEIPQGDPLFVVAQIELAVWARAADDPETELTHLDLARRAAPESFPEEVRWEELRRLLGREDEGSSPEP